MRVVATTMPTRVTLAVTNGMMPSVAIVCAAGTSYWIR